MAVAVKQKASSIVTFTGKRVWPTQIKPKDIDPLDIAHALSNLCRYNGHVSEFYSVAQHSCLMYDYADDDVKKETLLHDATEAYIGDMVAPLKHLDDFEFYRDLEDAIYLAVCDRFDMPYVSDPRVKELDLAIRAAEIRDLKSGVGSSVSKIRAAEKFDKITGWTPVRSKSAMMIRMRKVGIEV